MSINEITATLGKILQMNQVTLGQNENLKFEVQENSSYDALVRVVISFSVPEKVIVYLLLLGS